MAFSPAYPTFARLHDADHPLVLVNVWDAGSATTLAAAGAPAVATGSWAVAAAQGYGDGEELPWERVLDTAARIVASVDVPVSVDVERGYGAEPADVAARVVALRDLGVVGINLEDSVADGSCRPTAEAAARVAAARSGAGPELWINARTDVLFGVEPAVQETLLDELLARASAYAEAGASSIFVPGLTDPVLVERWCATSPLPVNVMATSRADVEALRGTGVSRISMGPGPYLEAMAALTSILESTRPTAR